MVGELINPPRYNGCTQVMQDSLGGNAKTLMFVNISPADYNQEETATALTYATRVKLITNTAEKQQVILRDISTRLFSPIVRVTSGEIQCRHVPVGLCGTSYRSRGISS